MLNWLIWIRTPPLFITDHWSGQEHCLIINNNSKCLCRQLERLPVLQNYRQISGPVSWTCGSSISSRRPSQGMSPLRCSGCGSGILCLFEPVSGIRNRFFPDSGSQTHIFDSIMTDFWVKIILWYMWLQKMVGQKKIFPLLFRCCWIPFIATVADPERFYAYRDTTFHFLITDFNVTTTAKTRYNIYING